MAAHQVTAKPLAQADRRFEIDRGPDIEPAECSDVEGFDGNVGVETIVVQFNRGQANTIDGDTFAEFVIRPGQSVGAYTEAYVATALLNKVREVMEV